jgi:hypothetical protein
VENLKRNSWTCAQAHPALHRKACWLGALTFVTCTRCVVLFLNVKEACYRARAVVIGFTAFMFNGQKRRALQWWPFWCYGARSDMEESSIRRASIQ